MRQALYTPANGLKAMGSTTIMTLFDPGRRLASARRRPGNRPGAGIPSQDGVGAACVGMCRTGRGSSW